MFVKWIAAIAAGLILAAGLSSASSVQASGVKGLNVYVYNWNTDLDDDEWENLVAPWRKGTDGSTLCKSTRFDTINHNWGEDSVAGCNDDDVLVNYQGYLSVPRSGLYTFYSSTDDGFYLKIGATRVIVDWEVQGMGFYSAYGRKHLNARQRYTFDAWLFENEGDAGAALYYRLTRNGVDGPISLVPQDWYRIRE